MLLASVAPMPSRALSRHSLRHLTLLLALLGCGDAASGPPEVTSSITLVARPDTATLHVGATLTLTAQRARGDGTWDPVPAQWVSSNPGLATVDANTGVVRGVAPGRVGLTASYGPGTASASVDVVP